MTDGPKNVQKHVKWAGLVAIAHGGLKTTSL